MALHLSPAMPRKNQRTFIVEIKVLTMKMIKQMQMLSKMIQRKRKVQRKQLKELMLKMSEKL